MAVIIFIKLNSAAFEDKALKPALLLIQTLLAEVPIAM